MDGRQQSTENIPFGGETDKAWSLLENLVTNSLTEQRRSRRWGIFFKFLTFMWLFLVASAIYNSSRISMPKGYGGGVYTALVELNGVIADGGDASADVIVSGLRSAFDDKGTKAVILRINSPGGSPVQSGYIYDEIIRLRKLHIDTPLYAVITDMGASGGYYVASAADAIYADKASMVGSIGVVSAGFGFVEAMKKVGVARRSYTAGEYKGFMDPFQSEDIAASKRWQDSLDTVHKQFIESVKHGRGDRLTDDPDIFSGMIWVGEKAKELGLLDGLGGASFVARDIVGVEEIKDFTPKVSRFERFARDFGVGTTSAFLKIFGADGIQLR
ncbi:MAG: S49 family peptidase [Candidatus Endonucleobacter sp. (ex Gigantidas childressi)]|nr:S49 family peptidase [Candidatus Endonucleobacter sp. (ex Gigantidas childressi)]